MKIARLISWTEHKDRYIWFNCDVHLKASIISVILTKDGVCI